MKQQKKDQFVVAYLGDLSDNAVSGVLSHARRLAAFLQKGLILLYVDDPSYKGPTTDEAEALLADKKADGETYCALKGDTKTVIAALPTLLNAVAVVAYADAQARRNTPANAKQLLRNFSECKTAYLVVQRQFDQQRRQYAPRVGFTVDYLRESKEKFLWASYLARFDGSSLFALYVDYSDEGLKQKWYNNMKFLLKFLEGFKLSFQPVVIGSKPSNIDLQAVEFAHANAIDMLCCLTTKDKDFLDKLAGPQEQQTIVNQWQIPILFLNPRDDLYVLCD
ncbi:MAG: hypothetical protein IJU81_04930 [Bacteroidales bacterium]|nr:hypothetical protein [Bacteroidales bacterium]